MQKRNLFILIAGALLLTSCSPHDLLKGVGIADDDDRVTPYSCPLSYHPNSHVMKLTAALAIPEKMAVIHDGELKYDECLEEPIVSPKPVVYVSRYKNNKIEVVALHYGAYKEFPATASYEILDRGDCTGNPISFFVANQVPLNFKKINYDKDHAECGGYYISEVSLQQ